MEIRIPINGGLFEWLIRWRMFAWLKRLDERASLTGNASVSREGYRWWGQVFVEREGRNMNLDQRIEAAARAMVPWPWEDHTNVSWTDKSASREEAIRDARTALQAAFPELFTDPPRAWIAPWEATEGMRGDADAWQATWQAEGGAAGLQDIWSALRDAHLTEPKQR